jgi:hypothetical protein
MKRASAAEVRETLRGLGMTQVETFLRDTRREGSREIYGRTRKVILTYRGGNYRMKVEPCR